jgi:septal ring factor EnvC (AmiA/AmiB activator)
MEQDAAGGKFADLEVLKRSWVLLAGCIAAATATAGVCFGLGVKYEEAVAAKETEGAKIEVAEAKSELGRAQAQLEAAKGKIDRMSEANTKLQARVDELSTRQTKLDGQISQLASNSASGANCAWIHDRISETERQIRLELVGSPYGSAVPQERLEADRKTLEERLARYLDALKGDACK